VERPDRRTEGPDARRKGLAARTLRELVVGRRCVCKGAAVGDGQRNSVGQGVSREKEHAQSDCDRNGYEREPHCVAQLTSQRDSGRPLTHEARWYHPQGAKSEERVALVELRRFERTPIDVEVEFERKGSGDRRAGRATDISLGGMFVRVAAPPGFSTEIVVYIRVRGHRGPIAIPGVVRWTRGDGMGIQFGLLGARETHAITELAKR
jgi:PilZ domain